MKYEFKPSFDKSVKSLPPGIREEIKALRIGLIDILSGTRPISGGLGLKNLQKNYWEIRKGLRLRILFRWQDDLVEFIQAGTHDDIKNFLKR